MDKNTLSTFGWIVVVVIIISIMIAFATPFGQKAIAEIQKIPDKLTAAFFPGETSTDVGSDVLEQETSTQHTHHYIASTAKSATCTEPGITLHECSCGDIYTEAIPMTEHTAGDEWQYDESTHWHICDVCGEETDTAEHTPNIDAATDTEDKYCTVCLLVLEATTGHQHHYETSQLSSPCTIGVYNIYQCDCGDSYSTKISDPIGHDPGDPATCTTAQKCKRCGEVLMEALEHNYTASYSAWTIDGLFHSRTAYCVCGASQTISGAHIQDPETNKCIACGY